MIRKLNIEDKDRYIAMSKEFYSSDAVLHTIPEENIYKTFDLLTTGSPYAEGYIFEYGGQIAGYALLSQTYSNEAGGLVLWIEEVYILPEYRRKGLGHEFFVFVEQRYKGMVARIRLEADKTNERAIELYRKLGFANLNYLQMYKEV